MKHFVQPIPVPVLDVSFNANLSALPAVLTALGFTYTCSSVRYYWDGTAFQQLAANAFHTSLNPVNGKWGYFPESSLANTTKWSCDFSNVLWVKTGGITRANATSCISGQVASKLTAAASTDFVTQIGGTSATATGVSDAIIEQGTSTSSRIEFYDDTNLTPLADATINWSTGVVTSSLGSNLGILLKSVGQNSGKLYKLSAITTTATSSVIRSIRVYPDTVGGGYCYLHYASCISASNARTMSPIVTGASTVTRSLMSLTSITAIGLINGLKPLLGISLAVTVNFLYHTALSRFLVQVTGSATTERCYIFVSSVANISTVISTAALTSTVTPANLAPAGVSYTFGGSARATSVLSASGGIIGRGSASASLMPVITSMTIGSNSTSTGQTIGSIERVRVYNYLDMQALARATL
jgi:hypothetical protein